MSFVYYFLDHRVHVLMYIITMYPTSRYKIGSKVQLSVASIVKQSVRFIVCQKIIGPIMLGLHGWKRNKTRLLHVLSFSLNNKWHYRTNMSLQPACSKTKTKVKFQVYQMRFCFSFLQFFCHYLRNCRPTSLN